MEAIYTLADQYQENNVRIQEIIGQIVFHFKGDFLQKLALFFEISASDERKEIMTKEIICKFLQKTHDLFDEIYQSAREIASKLNKSP